MNKQQQVNAVAMGMQPLLQSIDAAVTRLIGTSQHNIVLVIGCADVSQYAANVPRENGVAIIKDLFARWQLGMDDVLPDEVSVGDTQAFEYLLDLVEKENSKPEADRHPAARAELLAYVGRLEARAKRNRT